MSEKATLTTTAGAPIGDNQNAITAGPHGPVLLEDYQLLEKLAHQNRERIPERTVHAKGWGAHGTFTVTHDITKYTKAAVFSQIGKKTEVIARFSNVAGELGAADAERDLRGFAVKFYTEEGNWDFTGNNTPIFFVRDPNKFPDFIHTQKRHPRTNMRSPTAMWDFWSLSPESLHQVTWLMGDRGLPQSPRFMNGYGSHAYSFINARNERVWVKFHFKTQQGIKFFTNHEAEAIVAKNRESFQADLFGAIERRDAHRYRLGTHYEALPVNRPRCPVHNYHKDGAMRFFEPATNPDAFYEPNSFNGPVEDPRFVEPPLELSGDAARYNHREDNDDYRQPGDLFRLIGKEAQQRLVSNVAEAMQGVPREIVERQLGHCAKADPKYAEGVAHALGMTFRQAAE